MHRIYFFIFVLIAVCAASTSSLAGRFGTDPLAPRDEWGLLHQSPSLNTTDFDRRYPLRVFYHLEWSRSLTSDPAYVGALQRDLIRLGYYCGPIDGIYSDEVSDAIARLQKNYSLRVTGTLNLPVRRALHLP
ncbi:MAG: putative peptidoglycan binding domain [Verrucomicrobiota bacterium]